MEIPGIETDPLAALLIGRLLLSPIQSALERSHLLLTGPASPDQKAVIIALAQSANTAFQKFRAELPGKVAQLETADAIIARILDGACENPAAGFFGFDNRFLLMVDVTELAAGLQKIKEELARFNLLRFSEIAHFDLSAGFYRTFYPDGCDKPFERHLVLMLHRGAPGLKILREGIP